MNKTTTKENKMNDQAVQNLAHRVGSMKETMSSLEIARLTGKEHHNVLADIRKFLQELDEGGELKFQGTYIDSQGKVRPLLNLPKRESLGLASGYNAKLRMAVIDRWAELEAREQQPVLPPKTRVEAALQQADSELGLRQSIWKKLGMKKVERDSEALETLRSIEHDHMVTGLVPTSLANRVAKLDPFTKKVVETALSGKHVRPIRLANLLGYGENTKNASLINSALCAMGLQMRHLTNNNAFMPINAGVNIANVDDVGPHKGVLVGWEPVKTCEVLEGYFAANPTKAPRRV